MKQKLKYLLILAVFMLCMYKPFTSEASCRHVWHPYITDNPTYCGRLCALCGKVETRSGYKHNWKVVRNIDGSKTHIRSCSRCGSVKILNCSISWQVTKYPTCGSAGTRTGKCSGCNSSFTESIPATGAHTFGAWQSDANNHWRTCTVCGYKQGPSPHTNVNGKCSTCGRVLHTHNTSGKSGYKAPTCTTAGGYYPACSVDGTITGGWISVPATGHSYGIPYKTQERTCLKDEVWMKDCVHGDSHVVDHTVPAYNHDLKKTVWYSKNGVENAYYQIECERCGAILQTATYTKHTVTFLRVDKDNDIELERQTGMRDRGEYVAGNEIGTEDIIHDGIPYFYDSCETKVVNGEITVKAYYRKTSYIVSYDGNGNDSGTMGNQTIKYDSPFTLLPNQYSRVGYTFKGWSKEKTGSVMYTDKQQITNLIERTETGNTVTLYAVWEANKYKVHFENTKGIKVDDITVTYDQPYGDLPDIRTDTERVRAWVMTVPRGDTTGVVDISSSTIVKTTSDHTLTADWKYLTWDVTFLSPSQSQIIEVRNSETAIEPFTPSETGMQFLRWSEKPNGEEAFDFNTPITEDKTLYAVFKYKTYTITLMGTGTQDRVYPTTIGTLPNGYQKGSIFGGWYYDSELTQKVNSSDAMPPRDITLYPKYTIGQYKLTYQGYTDNYTLRYGDNIPTLITPTADGKEFLGWKYESEYVKSGDLFDWDHDVELVPDWKAVEFIVTFPDGTVKSLKYGDEIGNLPTPPNKAGSKFIGFVDSKGNTVTESTKVFENITINYVYENAKIILHLVDDDWSRDVQVEAGVTVTNLPTRSKDGYGFRGWSTYANGPATHGPFYAETTLYASYEAGMQNIVLSDLNQTIQRKVGSELGSLPSVSKDGFRFDGWTNNGNLVDSSTIVPAGGMTLVAKFTQINIDRTDVVVIRYFSDGVRINTVDLARGDILYNPGAPAVSGVDARHFLYWADENGREYQFGHTVAADTNLYAVWR